ASAGRPRRSWLPRYRRERSAGRYEICTSLGDTFVEELVASRAMPSRCLDLDKVQTAIAHPTPAPRWDPDHQRMRGNITSDDSSGRHHGIGADPYAGEDHAARSEGGAVLDARLHQPSLAVAIALGDRGQRHSRASR